MQTSTEEIEKMIRPTTEALGFDLVQVKFSGGGSRSLQILAERPGGGMNVDDCAKLSREVSVILDVENPIDGGYALEVSSPGLDRPLTRIEDYVRFAGEEAKIDVNQLVEGRRRWKGNLMGVEGDNVRLRSNGEEILIPFEAIQKAKLIVEDEKKGRK